MTRVLVFGVVGEPSDSKSVLDLFFTEKEEFLVDDDGEKVTHGDCSHDFYQQLTSLFVHSGKWLFLPHASSGICYH